MLCRRQFLRLLLRRQCRVKRIDISPVQLVLEHLHGFSKPLEMNHLTGPEEFDYIIDIRVVGQQKNVVVGGPCLLFCRHILREIRHRIALGRHTGCIPWKTGGRRGIDPNAVIYEIGGIGAVLQLAFTEIAGKLMNQGANHL